MPSPSAILHSCYYHIYNRGNNRQNIFIEERNYRYFLQKYAQLVTPYADTFAYCLLRNHFHLLVRVKNLDEIDPAWQDKKPGQVFGNFFNAYAKAFNRMYNRTGSLFENPFRRIVVTSEAHFTQLIVYIHQNPQKHGFVDDFRNWPYSSYHALLGAGPTRLQRQVVIDWFGGARPLEDAHGVVMREAQVAALVPEDFD
ncbi:MAG: transposase [Acidobacteriota bacterium]